MESTNGPTEAEILAGGAECVLAGGKKATVRMLPIRDYPAYFQLYADDNEAAMIAYAAALPIEEVEALSPVDHEKLVGEVERLNSAPFGRWVERKQARLLAVLPKSEEMLAVLTKTAATQTSSSSEPPRVSAGTR